MGHVVRDFIGMTASNRKVVILLHLRYLIRVEFCQASGITYHLLPNTVFLERGGTATVTAQTVTDC